MTGLVVDNFAGGGGASVGLEAALGRPVDIAINHDAEAVAMHKANHPVTVHLCQNIWQADPAEVCRGRPVEVAWFSPDCKHFSKAKGGKPVQRNIRDLAWVVVLWAKRARPRIIFLENVEEFREWGPLRLREDGKWVPDPLRKGETFYRWIRELRRLGYAVEWRELRACDYGAPTSRKRLFLIARRDGQPIVWPEPTHGPGLLPYRTAAECIDWSIPCPTIFGRKRPLVEATERRIAKGLQRYVFEAAQPFIVPVTHAGDSRVHPIGEPLRTITTAHRGEHALVAPFLVPRYGERDGQEPRTRSVETPMPTIVPTANGGSLVAAFMAQHNTGMTGHAMAEPVSTIVQKGSTQALVAAHLLNMKGSERAARSLESPTPTICASTVHAGLVAAFLVKYFGTANGQDLREPLHTVTGKARFGLVTFAGVDWQIVDIGMRMLTPRELFRAQGFPDSYVIAPKVGGKPLTKTAQIRMCGNSVCPDVARAIVAANVTVVREEVAA